VFYAVGAGSQALWILPRGQKWYEDMADRAWLPPAEVFIEKVLVPNSVTVTVLAAIFEAAVAIAILTRGAAVVPALIAGTNSDLLLGIMVSPRRLPNTRSAANPRPTRRQSHSHRLRFPRRPVKRAKPPKRIRLEPPNRIVRTGLQTRRPRTPLGRTRVPVLGSHRLRRRRNTSLPREHHSRRSQHRDNRHHTLKSKSHQPYMTALMDGPEIGCISWGVILLYRVKHWE